MVKADPTRNYYADLKVTASASENEIRKAFRTLALQNHPDRNPGREAEFVVKFQEIQAAHEILSDATQRAKYDAERRKLRSSNIPTNTPNTPRTRPPPPSRNAHTTTTPSGSYYRAPPPKPPPKPPPQPQRPPPPQQYNTFHSGADRFTSKNFRPPPTAQRHDTRAKDAEARANVFTAWQKMKQPRAEEARQTSSQNSFLNNPNGAPFGRSNSTRVPSSKQGFNPSAPGADEGQARSAYRNYARPAPTPPHMATPPHGPSHPPKDATGNEVPYAEANRVRTPYYFHNAGERMSMFEGLGRSASVRNSPTHSHRPSPSNDPGAYSDSGRRQQRNSYSGKSSKQFPQMYPDSGDDDSDSEDSRTGTQHRRPPPPPNAQAPPPIWGQDNSKSSHHRRMSDSATENTSNSFKSRSEENIHMKFSPSNWHGKFEGSADYFAPKVQRGSTSRGRTSPTRGRAPQRSAGHPPVPPFAGPYPPSYPIPPPPPGPPPNANFPPPPNAGSHSTKFSPQAWAETFKDPHWVFTDTKETSPKRASEATKRQKAARKPSVAQNGRSKSQDQSGSSRPKFQTYAEETSNGDADAMDIDSNTPPVPQGARKYGWSGAKTVPGGSTLPNGSASAPSSATATKPPATGIHGISGLGKVEPFSRPARGGLGLDDLKDNLPFPSQAANSHPSKPNSAQKLKFPDMPVAPLAPTKLDPISSEQYFSRMGSYVKAYKAYSRSLTNHFVARNIELEQMDDHFIHHRGETSKKIGFASYLAKIREDEEVMETWKLAQERHIQALQQCEEIRNKAIKMYQTLQT